jgi:hypothetical protein
MKFQALEFVLHLYYRVFFPWTFWSPGGFFITKMSWAVDLGHGRSLSREFVQVTGDLCQGILDRTRDIFVKGHWTGHGRSLSRDIRQVTGGLCRGTLNRSRGGGSLSRDIGQVTGGLWPREIFIMGHWTCHGISLSRDIGQLTGGLCQDKLNRSREIFVKGHWTGHWRSLVTGDLYHGTLDMSRDIFAKGLWTGHGRYFSRDIGQVMGDLCHDGQATGGGGGGHGSLQSIYGHE